MEKNETKNSVTQVASETEQNTPSNNSENQETLNYSIDKEQQSTDEIFRLTEENNSLRTENSSLKKEMSMLKLGIRDEYKNDAMTLANNLVNIECSFEQALKAVMKKYPQFASTRKTFSGFNPIMNYDMSHSDAFVSGINNDFLGGE